jgi:hypothetical protein
MVLWEPVVNGCEYLASLRRAHRDLLASNAELDGYEEHEKHGQDCFAELAGFPISRQLHDQVSAIDLLAAPTSKAILDTLVLANSDKPSLKEYVAARAHGRHRLDYVATGESDGIWLREDRQNDGLIPAQAIQEVVAWISRRV